MSGQTNAVGSNGRYAPSNATVQSLATHYAELQAISANQGGSTTTGPILRRMETLLRKIDQEALNLPAGDRTLVAAIRSEVQSNPSGRHQTHQTVWGDKPLGGAVYGFRTVEGYDL